MPPNSVTSPSSSPCCIALALGTLPIVGAARGNAASMKLARPAAQALFVFVAIAFGCLMTSFVTNDFSVLNVASHSNTELPLDYRIAAVWGGHEGSMLLWVLMLGGCGRGGGAASAAACRDGCWRACWR